MSFEEYAASKGVGFPSADHGLLRATASMSRRSLRDAQKREGERISSEFQRWLEMHQEYEAAVEAGDVRPPTRIERLKATANGHPDNASVQAARRILSKQGIPWE